MQRSLAVVAGGAARAQAPRGGPRAGSRHAPTRVHAASVPAGRFPASLGAARKGSHVCRGVVDNEPGYIIENWFNCPPGETLDETLKTQPVPTVPMPEHSYVGQRYEDQEGRVPFDAVPVDMEIDGKVTEASFYHGCFVDIGAEYPALIPIDEFEWFDVRGGLKIGAEVRVKVSRRLIPGRHRFPIEADLVQPDLSEWIHPKPDRIPPIIIRADDELDDVAAETGRDLPTNPSYGAFEWHGEREWTVRQLEGDIED